MSRGHVVDKTISLGTAFDFEKPHALRVGKLALQLFDQLQPLHGMGNTERIWLHTAALLHDIGKKQDPKDHHKTARDIIVNSSDLPFRRRERVMIGLVARYHRGPLPSRRHSYFGKLEREARRYVARLAALLRLADSLDKGRAGRVENLCCEVGARCVRLTLRGRGAPGVAGSLRKTDLFEKTFRKRVAIDVETARECLRFCLASAAEARYASTG